MNDDTELLRRYAEEGVESAFAEVVARRVDLVFGAALRQTRGNVALARDVVQVVFTDLARKAATVARHETAVGWLHTATRFAAAKAMRAEGRRQRWEQEAQLMNDVTDGADAANWERLRPVIDDALGELKERERAAILLRFFGKKPLAEVGASLAMSGAAARSCVDRALDKLHAALARRGVTSTAAALGVALANQIAPAAPAGLATSVAAGALAAGVSSSGVAGVLTFMNTLKTSVSMVVAAVAIGFGLYETQRRSLAETAAVAGGDEREELQAQLNAMRKTIMRSEQRAVRAEEQLGALDRKTRGLFSNQMSLGSAPASGAGLGAMQEPRMSFFTAASADPGQARQQLRNLNRPAVSQSYSPFCRKLGFTPEERVRFDELALDNKERSSALFKKAAASSATQDRDSLQTLAEVVNDQNYETLGSLVRDTFGEKVGEEFQRFQETMSLRPITTQLASALFCTDAPLTPTQAEHLIDILARNSRSAGGKVNPAEMDKSAVLAAARTVLSAPQIDAFSGYIDQTIRRGAMRR